MTPDEFARRHAERYRQIMYREITLAEALAANEEDWRALQDSRPTEQRNV